MEDNSIVYITLDRPRAIRLTNGVLKRFSAKHKINVNDLEEVIQRFDLASDLLYEMLKVDDPTLTQDQFDVIFDLVSVVDVYTKIAEAISAGFGHPADSNAETPIQASLKTAG